MEPPTAARRACLTALCLSAWALPSAGAQRVRGTVRDSVSGVGVPGAVVSVLDAAGTSRARTIAGQDGRFSVARPDGATRLRVIRIGFAPRDVPLPANDDSVRVAMLLLPALLARVRVSEQSVCGHSDDRTDALALWEQARAGLLATVVARETRPGRTAIVSFVTDLDPDSRIVLRQTLRADSGLTSRPFVATAPASAFARNGYLERDTDDVLTFFAPDADVLLDPGFAATHCFGVTSDETDHPGQIGLAFEPARPRDGFVDVRGTLWIDRTAPKLRTLEYTYTGLQDWYLKARTGGVLSFHTMPNGLAFIDRWVMHLQSFTAELDRPASASAGQRRDVGTWTGGGKSAIRTIRPQPDGRFALCGVQRQRALVLSAWRGSTRVADTTLHLGAADGSFLLPGVPPGRWAVRVRRIGFTLLTDTIVAEADRVVRRVYELGGQPALLDTVTTRGTASFSAAPRAIPIDTHSPRGCWVTTYVDGIRVYDPGSGLDAPDFAGMQVSDLAGVEFYPGGATLPPQFNATGSGGCGTLLLWTRE